ncbi:MAG TPA: nucleotidyl transferase AbiEii/AbiGii toxin family protein, partial [Blastocatellia bacterium]
MPLSETLELFESAIDDLIDWLESEAVPYTLIGGIAVSLLSAPRATQDVDCVIWLDEARWAATLKSAERFHLVSRMSSPVEFARRARVFLLQHQPSGISLDVSLAALPFEREMIERSRNLSRGGISARVPSIEDLIITKLVAHRLKDLVDVESLLSASSHIDLARIRKFAKEFAEATDRPEIYDDFEQLLRETTRQTRRSK